MRDGPYADTVFLTGGAVRDEIMGKPIKDIDVVVTEKDGGIKFANWFTKKINAHKEGANPVIYPRFGTAKFNLRGVTHQGVDLSGVDIESVMTRGEKYETGSRKPEVVYADLKTDAERRDLTVNSLYKNIVTGEIKDLTGKGISDIKKGIVRTPLDPDITFQDDPLRMMRAVRFAVKYDWKMPRYMLKSIQKNAPALKSISAERIQDEFNKMLLTDHPDQALRILSLTGLNKHIIPELDDAKGIKQNEHHEHDVYDHILEVVRHSPKDLTARLAALFHDIGKPVTKTTGDDGRVHFYEHEDVGAGMAKKIMTRLKYPNQKIESVSNIVANHMRLKSAKDDGSGVSDKTLRKFISALGDDLQSALTMMHADNVSHKSTSAMPNQIPKIQSRVKNLMKAAPAKPKLPVNGHDIMKALNLKPGPEIKNILSAIEDVWYERPELTAADAMKVAKFVHQKGRAPISGKTAEPTKGGSPNIQGTRIQNPLTKNNILIKTALKYPHNHPVRRAAEEKIRRLLKK